MGTEDEGQIKSPIQKKIKSVGVVASGFLPGIQQKTFPEFIMNKPH